MSSNLKIIKPQRLQKGDKVTLFLNLGKPPLEGAVRDPSEPIKQEVRISIKGVKQDNDYNCGPAALKMILDFYGFQTNQAELAKESGTNEKSGTLRSGMIKVVERLGLKQVSKDGATIQEIEQKIDAKIPVLVAYRLSNIDGNSLPNDLLRKIIDPLPQKLWRIKERWLVFHYGVVVGYDQRDLLVLNPWTGKEVKYDKSKFEKAWYDDEGKKWMMVITPSDKNKPDQI